MQITFILLKFILVILYISIYRIQTCIPKFFHESKYCRKKVHQKFTNHFNYVHNLFRYKSLKLVRVKWLSDYQLIFIHRLYTKNYIAILCISYITYN